MIDVVFLLLVFFMLASRFETTATLPVSGAGAGAVNAGGPPRLVDVAGDEVRLNGITVDLSELARRIEPLMDDPGDLIVLRPIGDVDLQRLVDVLSALDAAGYGSVAVAGGPE